MLHVNPSEDKLCEQGENYFLKIVLLLENSQSLIGNIKKEQDSV